MIGDEDITHDAYNEPITEMPLKECIAVVAELVSKENYCNDKVLLQMLLAFDTPE